MLNIKLIEAERTRQGISKYRMSQELKMSRQAYYDILKRKSTTFQTVDKIANILSLKKDRLLI